MERDADMTEADARAMEEDSGGGSGSSPAHARTPLVRIASMSPEKMQSEITKAQRTLRCIRWSVSGTLLLLSLTLAVTARVFFFRMYGDGLRFPRCYCSAHRHAAVFLSAFSRALPFMVWNLAPLESDLWLTRFVLLVDAVWIAARHQFQKEHLQRHGLLPGWFKADALICTNIGDALKLCGIFALMFGSICPPLRIGAALRSVGESEYESESEICNRMQANMWRLFAMGWCLDIGLFVWVMLVLTSECGCVLAGWWYIFCHAAMLLFALRPQWRQSIHAKMLRVYSRRHARRAAAGIAGLVGSQPAREVMAQASGRFRGVYLSDLAFEEMKDNQPNDALYERTFPIRLSECDAFISHSWHDEPEMKWAALQEWRARFQAEHGRPPVLWIDKCCIDQKAIDANLRCLPIFLSGCRKLVVFLGESYLRRLWCVMELFVFVHMRRGIGEGVVEQIEFIPLRGREGEVEGAGPAWSLRRKVKKFDVGDCQCFKEEDKAKMLRIIRAAFGDDLGSFNAVVRTMLSESACFEISDSDGESSASSEPSGCHPVLSARSSIWRRAAAVLAGGGSESEDEGGSSGSGERASPSEPSPASGGERREASPQPPYLLRL